MYRQPYAYWKGNPDVAAIRQELVKCNVSSEHEWNARIYKQVLCFSLCCIQVYCTWRYYNAPFASHKLIVQFHPIKFLNLHIQQAITFHRNSSDNGDSSLISQFIFSIIQDWVKEIKAGYKQSNLASQCIHRFAFSLLQIRSNLFCSVSNADLLSLGDRYKIYIEGSAWSVSEKYILACDSMTLVVAPKYYDFYSRVLMPMQHYWPVRDDNKCSSIKYAVDWGNSHKQKVFI